MASLPRALGLSALVMGPVFGAEGARVTRQGRKATHDIHGIPIMNFPEAFGGVNHAAATLEEETWIIMGNARTSDAALAKLCSESACKQSGHPSKGGVPFLKVRGTLGDLERLLKDAKSFIDFVEPDLPIEMVPEIDEAQGRFAPAPSLWGLTKVGREKRPADGKNVHIYVFDTGVRTSHGDFGGRASAAVDMSSGRLVECQYGGGDRCGQDYQGHGTHCAGTAAGTTYGVAPAALVHSVKVLDDNGGGTLGWSIEALDWAGYMGDRPAVASMSLGGRGRQESMFRAVELAVNAGVHVVVAAGNSNSDACDYSPAFATPAFTVGSTTLSDTRSSFSNFGRCVDIWAPGSGILSAGHTSDSDTEILSGTSMACPHVSGAAALILEENPSNMPRNTLEAMYDNAWRGGIRGLFPSDKNTMLYVGSDGPPASPAPTPAPPTLCREFSHGPDQWGDCVCDPGYDCWWGDYGGCPYSATETNGINHRFYYLPSCEDCQCWPMR